MEEAKKSFEPIMSLFSGNPFSTPVGHKIEQATDASRASEDWALNMEICDMINSSEEAPKDAVRAIRKRLGQNAGKNYTVVMYTLTVLETCVKNCGKRFHILVCQKDFVQDLVKLIGAKTDAPLVVQEKVLGIIQSWADTFQENSELSGVVQVYQDLKSKGIEFPMTDLDSMAPILTPKRSVEAEPILFQVDFGERQLKVTPDQAAKIRRDLDLVQGNMAVFAEMLSELKPGNEDPNDLELIQELYTSCKEIQRRIADLLCTISSDDQNNLTADMLHINDELNNLFLRYGRCRKNIEKTTGGPPSSATTNTKVDNEPSLIDFGNEQPDVVGGFTSKMGGLNVSSSSASAIGGGKSPRKDDGDFDMFAQSRTASYEKSKSSGSTYADNSNVDQGSSLGAAARKKEVEEDIIQMHRESDFDEMEAWLKANPGAAAAGAESTLTSSEFDKFLQERASAATSSSSSVAGNRPPTTGGGGVDKEKTENKMFAL